MSGGAGRPSSWSTPSGVAWNGFRSACRPHTIAARRPPSRSTRRAPMRARSEVGREHQAEARDDGVPPTGLEVDRRDVEHARGDVAEPRTRGARGRLGDHLGRDVRRQDVSLQVRHARRRRTPGRRCRCQGPAHAHPGAARRGRACVRSPPRVWRCGRRSTAATPRPRLASSHAPRTCSSPACSMVSSIGAERISADDLYGYGSSIEPPLLWEERPAGAGQSTSSLFSALSPVPKGAGYRCRHP